MPRLSKGEPPRRKPRWARVVGLGVVVAIGVAAWAGSRALAQRGADKLRQRWQDFRSCVIGEPLQPDETAGERVRRVELAAATSRFVETPAWPERCASVARSLEASVEPSIGERDPELTRVFGVTRWFRRERSEWTPEALEKLSAAWSRLPLHRLEGSTIPARVRAAPPPIEMLGEQLTKHALGPAFVTRVVQRDPLVTDPVASDRIRLLLTESSSSPEITPTSAETLSTADVLCELTPNHELTEANCRRLPPPLADGLNPHLADLPIGASFSGGQPIVVRAEQDNGGPGLFRLREDRARLVEPTLFDAPPAHVSPQGDIYILRRLSKPAARREYIVRRGVLGGALRDVRLAVPTALDLGVDETIHVDLIGRHVFWTRGVDKGARQLAVQTVTRADEPTAPTEIGEVPYGSEVVAACRTTAMTGMLWAEPSNESEPRKGRWVVAEGGRFSSAEVTIHGNPWVSCRGKRATLVSGAHIPSSEPDSDKAGVEVSFRFFELSCELSKCDTTQSEAFVLPLADPQRVRAVPIARGEDTDVLVAWAGNAFPGGETNARYAHALFIRRGPLEALHEATDELVSDNATYGGQDTAGIDVFVRHGKALLTWTVGPLAEPKQTNATWLN